MTRPCNCRPSLSWHRAAPEPKPGMFRAAWRLMACALGWSVLAGLIVAAFAFGPGWVS